MTAHVSSGVDDSFLVSCYDSAIAAALSRLSKTWEIDLCIHSRKKIF